MATKKADKPSKQSIAMKKSWQRRKAEKKVIVTRPKTMKIRVISHQEGIQIDTYTIEAYKFGELMDILHNNYMGIAISEIQIQIGIE